MIDARISSRIANLTCFCTLIIVLLHLSLAGVGRHLIDVPVGFIAQYAVPTFFAISGFLLSQKIGVDNWYGLALKRRFFTLVVPYISINILYLPVIYVYHNILKLGTWPGGGLGFDWYTVSRIFGLTPEFHPACGPIWYIRCLVMFVVLSPLFVVIIKKSRLAAALGCVVLFCVVSWLELVFARHGLANFAYSFFSLRGLLLFIIGIAYGYWCANYYGLRKNLIIGFVCAVIGTCCYFGDYYSHGCSALSLAACMFYVSTMWFIIPEIRLSGWIRSSCFAIYALHMLFFNGHAVLVKCLGLRETYEQSEFLWVFPVMLTLLLCFAITYVVRNRLPLVGRILFGGRC